MKHPLTTLVPASVLAFAMVAPAAAQEMTEVWTASGFSMPESVSYDPASGSLFVSNINSPDMSANGQGYISRISLEGEVLAERFVEGLNAPKGTAIADGTLYVAGIGELVAISLETGEITDRHAAPDASFLNDVAVAEDGTVYVSETLQGAIYRLADGELSPWVADPQLAGANGLIIDGNALLVATMGDLSGGFENLQPSNVKSIDIASQTVTDYGSAEPIGALDGIEAFEGGVMLTDNTGGRLVYLAADGTIEVLGETGGGSADHEFVADESLVIVPVMGDGNLVAWRLDR